MADKTYYIDNTAADDSGNGQSEIAAWKHGDHATALADATPFTFVGSDKILFRAGQTHVLKKLRLIKQGSGGAGGPRLTIGRYGTGPDPILHTDGTNDEALLGAVISIDSCHRIRVENLELDAAWQTAGPGTGISGVGQKHVVDPSLIHSLECVNVKARRAGQDGFAFHYNAATEAPDPSLLAHCESDRSMDNGWGLYGASNGFTVWNHWSHGDGTVPDYGPFGRDGGSAHNTARNVLIAFCRYEDDKDGSHHINLGLPSGFIVGCYFRAGSESALKLMDYSAAAVSSPQYFAVIGCLFVLPAGMTGKGGVIWGRDGEDVPPATGVDAGTGGVFSGAFWHNTIYNASAKPGLFCSWKNHADNDTAIFDLRNNLFVKASTGAHMDLNRRTRSITFTTGPNAFSDDASGLFVLDGANKTLAQMISAGIIGNTSFVYDPMLVGDPDTDPANAGLQAESPAGVRADDLSVNAAALGTTVRDLYARLWPAISTRPFGCRRFASSPSGLLLPTGPEPGLAGYRFYDA